MSSALAIAGVTAVLRDRLNDGMVDRDISAVTGSAVTVTTLAPDRVLPAEGTEATQLNVFLYQVSPNTSWSNHALPSRDASGRQRLSNPPLALNLHYLISAYGSEPLHREILLGHVMQLMHQFPVLTREMITAALALSPADAATRPPSVQALADSGLADQIETLKITPQFLNSEELSKLWTATQSHFRPSAAYEVSVVLIEAHDATRSPLPVLTRGGTFTTADGEQRERGVMVSSSLIPPLPTIEAVQPAGNQPVAQLNRAIQLEGHHLNGSARIVLLHSDRFTVDAEISAAGTGAADHLEFTIPVARADEFPVGSYDISARLIMPNETDPRTSNRLGVVIAADITNLPATVARNVDGDAAFTLTFTPALRANQNVSLLLGNREIPPETFTAPTNALDFIARDAEPGAYLARLRIDGIDSPIIDHDANPPTFLDRRVTIT